MGETDRGMLTQKFTVKLGFEYGAPRAWSDTSATTLHWLNEELICYLEATASIAYIHRKFKCLKGY